MKNEEIIINSNDFNVHYQPIVSTENDDIVAVEALIRPNEKWNGLTNPSKIVSFAEDHFMVDRLDRYIMSQVCNMIHRNDLERKWLTFHVNISPLDLDNKNVVNDFYDIISKYDIPGETIMLELLETKEMDTARYSVLQELKNLGFKIGIDDYGTGFSSVMRLMEFDFDCVKISRELFEKVVINNKGYFMYEKAVGLLRNMNVAVVQEGIETSYQYDFIKNAGVNLAQGFLISKAVSEKRFMARIKEERLAS